jgi:SsrA-binding protein
VHWNDRGIAKVDIALVRGRKVHDKRQVDREKTARREMDRAMKRR